MEIEYEQLLREQQQSEQQQRQQPGSRLFRANSQLKGDIFNIFSCMEEFDDLFRNPSNDSLFEESPEEKFSLSFGDLLQAYREAKKHKSNTDSQILFSMDLSVNLLELYREIVSGTYRISTSKCFIVTRPKPREVFAANFRDRIVHHVVIDKLMPHFQETFIENSFSCMPKKGTLFGAKKLQEAMKRHPNGNVYIHDISGFFMHLRKDLLWEMLKEYIEEKFINDQKTKLLLLFLVEKIVMHHPELDCDIKGDEKLWSVLDKSKSLFTAPENCGLAIGNLTSQLFANFYLDKLDKFLYEKFGDDYGRYVDDFFIVCDDPEKVKSVIPDIEKILSDLGLTLHPKKRYSQPVRHGAKFLGYVVRKDRVYISNRTLGNFQDAIDNFNTMEEDVFSISGCIRSLNSYLGFTSYCNSYKVVDKILKNLEERWFKYLDINDDTLTNKEKEKGKIFKRCLRLLWKYKIINKI